MPELFTFSIIFVQSIDSSFPLLYLFLQRIDQSFHEGSIENVHSLTVCNYCFK